MTPWEEIIDGLVKVEGGYVNNPDDKGGPTKFGITEAVARAAGYTGAMQDLPYERAFSIYTGRYWLAPKFNEVFALSPVIATELLDTGVNMGVSYAGRFLQRALNVLNQKASLWPDLTVDGNIGPATLAALGTFLGQRGTPGVTVLLRLLNAQQAVRYMDICEANPNQESFLYGWVFNRVGGTY